MYQFPDVICDIISNYAKEQLVKFIDEKSWNYLSENLNNKDINMLEQNPNNKAVKLLKQNQDKINWNYLFENSNIFTYDNNDKIYNILMSFEY